jgi:hypothetical protein
MMSIHKVLIGEHRRYQMGKWTILPNKCYEQNEQKGPREISTGGKESESSL